MNRVVLIGRLSKEPELKYVPGTGTAVCTFPLAVDRRKKEDGADFIPIVIWGKQAENTANYVSKGKLVAVSGRIQTRSYDAKDGSKRYVTEVVADEVQFLEFNTQNSSTHSINNFSPSNIGNNDIFLGDMTPVDDSDIPF